jgi:Icc-related predicted phosphoesterase
MKITVVSDLHIDFADMTLPGGDVLILSGDVCEAKSVKRAMYNPDYVTLPTERPDRRADRFYRFFEEECSQKYRETIYVMGNHEHYHFKYHKTYQHLLENLPANVTLLQDQTYDIDDVTFVGTTLWTDMNRYDPMTLAHMKSMMSDYRYITMFDEVRNLYHKLDPKRTAADHKRSREYIQQVVQTDPNRKYVVVTHHAPSERSVHDQYKNDTLMNGAYFSELSDFIESHPQIVLWTHGHMHNPSDYMIGSTRVVCNPRGYYGHEAQAESFAPVIIEL